MKIARGVIQLCEKTALMSSVLAHSQTVNNCLSSASLASNEMMKWLVVIIGRCRVATLSA